MAYRRKQGSGVMGRSLTFKDETTTSTSSSLAVRALMASEGRSMDADGKTSADFNEETQKIQIRRKGMNEETCLQSANQTCSQEDQLKAARDVAMATAAKAKLLLRELRTVKADLAFAKERCSQLEEENKIHRESREKGLSAADDDMIRLQLETLLAEKGRLAHENSVYARENRVLREIVEYHQLTMQDVVYLNEGFEDDIRGGEEDDKEEYPSRNTSTRTMSISTCFAKDMLPKTTDVTVPPPH